MPLSRLYTREALAYALCLQGEKTYTVCGTPDYISPEIIQQAGASECLFVPPRPPVTLACRSQGTHSKRISGRWASPSTRCSRGKHRSPRAVAALRLTARCVALRGLLCGVGKPWVHTLRCVQVMKGVFECPDDMSPGAASLIRGLCTKDVSKRLGRLANGADDLRNHPWYTDAQFDWVSVLHPPASPLRRADFLSAAAAAAAVSGDAAALRARCEGRRGYLLFCGRGRLGRGGPVGMAERFAAD